MLAAVTHRLRARSATLLSGIEGSLDKIMVGWLLLVALASAARIATSPLDGTVAARSLVGFLLLAAAPALSGAMALRWFAGARAPDLPPSRRWLALRANEARRHPLYGAGGFMVSLLVGLLLNIAIRGAEYLAAMPALSGDVPHWLAALQLALTADVVLFSSLYAVVFVAALRRAPAFPPLLILVWTADLVMQIGIAQIVARQPDLPAAVGEAVHALFRGNAMKVAISMVLWLPYLMLSTRVNVTYRHRVPR